MVPIISIVGRSGTGKTTFLERLIPAVGRRGYRVGCIKHDAHRFEVDYPGKDTWRLREAGSRWVAIANDERLAVMGQLDGPLALQVIAAHFAADVDLILTEGYRHAGMPRIEIVRMAWNPQLLSTPDELFALVTDGVFDVPCPLFGLEDTESVAELIEQRFLRAPGCSGQVRVLVDGRRLPITSFDEEQWAMVLGALATHHGVTAPLHTIEIQLQVG